MTRQSSEPTDGTAEVTIERHEYIKGLRDLADFLEQHPDFPSLPLDGGSALTIMSYTLTREQLASMPRTLGGRWDKDADDTYYHLRRRFGPHQVQLYTSRGDVCERVQVGTRTVQQPAPDAPPVPMVDVEVPVYEWRCPDSLLADVPVTAEEDEAWNARDGGDQR